MVLATLPCWIAGCLLPPPVDEIPEVNNRAPRMLPESLLPHPTEMPFWTPSDCSIAFSATVADDDGDTLYWRVFDDYRRNLERRPDVRALSLDPIDHRGTIQFSRDAGDFLAFGDNPHVVELFVADRPFSNAGQPVGQVLDDEGEGLTATFVWTFAIDNSGEDCNQ